jgi:hypothetical protein
LVKLSFVLFGAGEREKKLARERDGGKEREKTGKMTVVPVPVGVGCSQWAETVG